MAHALLDAGWQVALAGRRVHTLRESAAGRDRTLIVPTDVTEPESVRSLFATVVDELGRVDLLFNNAGLFGTPAPVEGSP